MRGAGNASQTDPALLPVAILAPNHLTCRFSHLIRPTAAGAAQAPEPSEASGIHTIIPAFLVFDWLSGTTPPTAPPSPSRANHRARARWQLSAPPSSCPRQPQIHLPLADLSNFLETYPLLLQQSDRLVVLLPTCGNPTTMNKNWNDRADKDLFFTILSVKNIGVISGSEWVTIGNHMRSMGYGFTNEGCR